MVFTEIYPVSGKKLRPRNPKIFRGGNRLSRSTLFSISQSIQMINPKIQRKNFNNIAMQTNN
jgi:hypothetical protein